MTTKANKFFSLAVLAVLFAYVYWFSANALWLGDDINYRFVFDKNTLVFSSDKPLTSLADVVESQWAHFLVANGRYVAYTINQALFIFMGHTLFGLLNGFAYLLFVFLVVKLGLNLRKDEADKSVLCHPLAVAYVAIMSILCVSSKFVPSTAIGYVWTYNILLLFVWIYLFKKPKTIFGAIGLAVFAFIAGAAHDTISLGFAFGMAWYGLKNIKRLKALDWAVLICFGLGAVTLVLSPGAQSRVSTETHSLLKQIISLNYLRSFFVFLILFVIAKRRGYGFNRLFAGFDVWIVSIFGLFVFNLAIGGISANRQVFGIETISLILSVAIWRIAKISKTKSIVSLCVLVLLLGIKFKMNARTVRYAGKQYEEIREKYASSNDGTIEIEFASGHGAMRRVAGYIFGGVQDGLYGEDEASRNWQTVNMTRLFNHEMGTNKTLKYVVPMAREIKSLPDSTQVIETMPGNYYAIISKANPPKRVVAHRSALWGLKSWSDAQIYPSDDKPDFETSTLEAYAMFDQMYFVGIDSVEIEW